MVSEIMQWLGAATYLVVHTPFSTQKKQRSQESGEESGENIRPQSRQRSRHVKESDCEGLAKPETQGCEGLAKPEPQE